MAQEENRVEDVEEGEISDTASVEEISEEDFNKQEVKATKEETKGKPESRVWTMQDLYKYQIKRGYTSGLYNLAWAQAVQNKPLNEVFDLEAEQDENTNSKRSSSATSVNSKDDKNAVISAKEGDNSANDATGDEVDMKAADGEREEGELEEGEIDWDAEPSDKVTREGKECTDVRANADKFRKVNEIREDLASVIASNSVTSLPGVCGRIEHSLESLRELILADDVPSKDGLLQLLSSAVQAVYAAFCSMDYASKEQNRDALRRVLSLVSNASFLPPKQIKEVQEMICSLDKPAVLQSTRSTDNERDMKLVSGLNEGHSGSPMGLAAYNLTSSSNALTGSLVNNRNLTSENWKQGLSSTKGRGVLIPLLDLHKDHDADSLPSPTRQAPPALTVPRFAGTDSVMKPELGNRKLSNGMDDFRIRSYETEAVKAVSTYQQKFARNSIFPSDRLPSPTPSEEHVNGVADSGEEVSSSSIGNSNPPNKGQFVPSSPSLPDISMQGPTVPKSIPPVSMPNSCVKSLAKSRDPRLRFVNADSGTLELNKGPLPLVKNALKPENFGGIMTKKQKNIEDPYMDGPDTKRQRNGMENHGVVNDMKAIPRTTSFIEESTVPGCQTVKLNQIVENVHDPRKIANGVAHPVTNISKPNVTVSTSDPLRLPISSAAASSLPALLKGITGNPAMLVNLLKMGQQQKLAAEVQQKLADPPKGTGDPSSSSSILGTAPPVTVAPMASGILQSPAGVPQVPAQISSADDLGKIRMKPRDPRRILHGNTLQRSGSLGPEQLKCGPLALRSLVEGPADQKAAPAPPVVAPDITQQFTKNLRNVAEIISSSQALPTPLAVPQSFATHPTQAAGLDVKAVSPNVTQPQSGPAVTSDGSALGPPHSQSSWGDVEHLFEGYDDQQRAAIQRERARRIEEQRKMFSERKLCLVLDLDHTLLNSAKFGEVESIHDEILRKKEEQDREKPLRHLFRFPHMEMWTKLRPGIWNFLEKASKLYELHLYTMGNKLYATEMAKVLDPKGALFAGRVISRGDDGDALDGDERCPKSKDLEGVLGMESAVVIIDDSVRVWPHNKLNLIVVERYTYFPSSRRQFGLLGPSLLEIDHDERPEDGTLASSLSVIERIHQIFFSHQCLDEVDVRNILATEQRKILGGCKIVFSRVFPVGEANPHHHPLWQTAEQFGAVCTNQIDDQVTHVVANSLGTDKVNWALSTGRFVVHPGWVEASALLYRRANEQDFAIKP